MLYKSKEDFLDYVENVTGGILLAAWTLTVLWVFFVKPRYRTSWEKIEESSSTDSFGADDYTPPEHDEERSLKRIECFSSPTKDFEDILQSQHAIRREKTLPEWNTEEVVRFLKTLQLGHCVE